MPLPSKSPSKDVLTLLDKFAESISLSDSSITPSKFKSPAIRMASSPKISFVSGWLISSAPSGLSLERIMPDHLSRNSVIGLTSVLSPIM